MGAAVLRLVMAPTGNPPWRYGVALFPVPLLLSILAVGSLFAFVSLSQSGTTAESGVLVALATFALTVLSSWLATLVGIVVAASVFLDARAFADHEAWSPNRWLFGGIGLLHVAATELLVLNLVSVPALLYYLYRRRQHVS